MYTDHGGRPRVGRAGRPVRGADRLAVAGVHRRADPAAGGRAGTVRGGDGAGGGAVHRGGGDGVRADGRGRPRLGEDRRRRGGRGWSNSGARHPSGRFQTDSRRQAPLGGPSVERGTPRQAAPDQTASHGSRLKPAEGDRETESPFGSGGPAAPRAWRQRRPSGVTRRTRPARERGRRLADRGRVEPGPRRCPPARTGRRPTSATSPLPAITFTSSKTTTDLADPEPSGPREAGAVGTTRLPDRIRGLAVAGKHAYASLSEAPHVL